MRELSPQIDEARTMHARWTDRIPEAYFVACSLLMLIVLVPGEPSSGQFWLLSAVTFPTSLCADVATYVGGVILFGPGEWGLAGVGYTVLVWGAAVTFQALALRSFCRSRRSHRSAGNLA